MGGFILLIPITLTIACQHPAATIVGGCGSRGQQKRSNRRQETQKNKQTNKQKRDEIEGRGFAVIDIVYNKKNDEEQRKKRSY